MALEYPVCSLSLHNGPDDCRVVQSNHIKGEQAMGHRTTHFPRHLLCAAGLALAAFTFAAHAVEIKLSCTGVGLEAAFCKDAATAWAK